MTPNFLSYTTLASGGGCYDATYWDELPDTFPVDTAPYSSWRSSFNTIAQSRPGRVSGP